MVIIPFLFLCPDPSQPSVMRLLGFFELEGWILLGLHKSLALKFDYVVMLLAEVEVEYVEGKQII